MYFAKKLIDGIRMSSAIIHPQKTGDSDLPKPFTEQDKQRLFFDYCKDLKPFVFDTQLEKFIVDWPEFTDLNRNGCVLDLPFQVCSFENLEPGKPLFILTDSRYSEASCVWGMWVREVDPGVYETFLLKSILNVHTYHRTLSGTDKFSLANAFSDPQAPWLIPMIDYIPARGYQDSVPHFVMLDTLLNRVNEEAIGTESANEKIRVGTGDQRELIRIRKIIHVRPKSLIKVSVPGQNRAVDWSHRWVQRGHWRNLPGGLGKDREGNYCVPGKTWVRESVKGPDHAPLIADKVRLIHSKLLSPDAKQESTAT